MNRLEQIEKRLAAVIPALMTAAAWTTVLLLARQAFGFEDTVLFGMICILSEVSREYKR